MRTSKQDDAREYARIWENNALISDTCESGFDNEATCYYSRDQVDSTLLTRNMAFCLVRNKDKHIERGFQA